MKKLLILLLTLVFTSATFADKVTEEQALQKAQKFFKDKRLESKNLSRSKKAKQQLSATQEDFYVFNVENKGGFVIISGDDRTPEVLGYADSGNIDMDNLPPNLKGWLEGYSKQIKALETAGDIDSKALSRASSRAPKAAIEPMISTKWGQDYPYNMNCPDNCVTGCVATAMAQVMYYHRAKSTNKTMAKIPGYNGNTYWFEHGQISIDAIPEGSIIDWNNMLDRYDGSGTEVQKEAVANLMLYCGASVKMDYGANGIVIGRSAGSGADSFDVPTALKLYFDYSENTTLVWRQNYTDESWEELIYSELSKGNPIYYSGSNESSGHAFVCDGYDGNSYYHINWGWDGLSDSYFLLSALNPSAQGTGGSSEGYNYGQCALIGAVPNGEIMRLTSQNVSLTGNTIFTLSETEDNVTVSTKWKVKNQNDISNSFNHAIGLYSKGELIKLLKETGTSVSFAVDEEITVNASLDIETHLVNGVYQLYALSRSSSDDKWFRNENSSDCFITLVVKDGSMNFYVGRPAAAENIINFADDEVKRICVENWDTDGDGEISYEEAAAVTDFGNVFDRSVIRTFDEAQYFTGITSFGFANVCKSLTSIKLPSSVNSIKDEAFMDFFALQSIEIPASVKEIGKKAFAGCFSLQEIILHEGLEKINDEAFIECYELSIINIPASVTSLGINLWAGCSNLYEFDVDANNPIYCDIDGVIFSKNQKELISFPVKREGTYSIPAGTENVCSYAFSYSNLENIIIPTSVISLEDYALGSIGKLKEITIPSTVTTIGEGALFGCIILEKVIIDGERSIIPDKMFMRCWSLKEIELPDDITSIGSYAFYECYKLKEITIPSKVTFIGDHTFSHSGLKRVTSLMQIPCDINSTVFKNLCGDQNSSSIEDNYATLYVPEESLNAYKEADIWKDFPQILPIGENGIEAYAELNNGVLTFYFDTKRFERDGETFDNLEWFDKNSSITKVIFDSSFANYKPTSTCQWFDGCVKLSEIQGIEYLNTSKVTDMSNMFHNCSILTSIDLSSFNVSEVTNMAAMFSGCSSLTSIDLSSSNMSGVNSMNAMFWDCNNLKTVALPNDIAFIDSYQFVYCYSLEEILIPESVTSIRDNAFGCCYSLTEITIPSKVTFIGDDAFSYSGLTKVTSLMQSPCAISSSVFKNVSSNATLYVPDGCKAAYEAADNWKDFKKIMGPSSTLVYMVDGEEYCSYEIEIGTAITVEVEPTKVGYTFSGWSEIPDVMPDHDVTVTGSFAPINHTITYAYGQECTTWCSEWTWNKPNGITVYTISGVSGTTVSIEEVEGNVIPAYTPLILKKTGDDVTASFSSVGIGTNDLVSVPATGCTIWGNVTDDLITGGDYYSAGNTYVLYNGAFILANKDTGIPGNRCVLTLDSNDRAGARQLYLSVGETTGIGSVEDVLNGQWYSIDGRKLGSKPTKKGVYINNGQKVVIK